MKTQLAVLFAATLVAGCGSARGSLFRSSSAAGVAGNWQIQTSGNSAAASPQGIVLLGALEDSGGQLSGTFRFTNLAQPDACGLNQVVAFTGAAKSESSLVLTSAKLPNGTTIKVSLKITGTQPYAGIGTVEVDGSACTLASASAIGSKIESTTGTFSGTLSPGTRGAPASGASGKATVTLTQSASPGADGQFTETGTLNYKFGSCTGSVPLNGSVSGVGMNFWDIIFNSGSQVEVNLAGTTNSAATQINAGYLSLSPAPCSTDPDSSAVFSGKLNRQ